MYAMAGPTGRKADGNARIWPTLSFCRREFSGQRAFTCVRDPSMRSLQRFVSSCASGSSKLITSGCPVIVGCLIVGGLVRATGSRLAGPSTATVAKEE